MEFFDKQTKIFKGENLPLRFPSDLHISELILTSLRKTPDRVLQIYEENGAELTCDELRINAIRVAQNLAKLGIKDGDVVGFDCSNSEHICALVTGCVFLGAVANPLALEHGKDDIVHMWSMTEPKFVFCDAEVYEKVTKALGELENDAIVCTLLKRRAGALFLDDILASTGNEDDYQPIKCEKPNEKLLALLGSSGTTGPCKAVSLSQFTPIQFVDVLQGDGSINARMIHFGAIFWGIPYWLFVMISLSNLTRIVTRRPLTTENVLEIVEKFKVELLFLPPSNLKAILSSPLTKSADLSSLKFVSSVGSVTHPELREEFKRTFPDKRLYTPYGSTEIVITFPRYNDINDGYKVGRTTPNAQIKIVDDDGNALNIGEHGEICVKSLFPFLGYYRRAEVTRNAIDDDGFYKTGDIGFFNAEGYLHVVNRKKDIFKYHFHHINPAEIENVIQTMDGVEAVTVIGIPNAESHFVACAVIIKREHYENLTERDVVNHVAARLPPYKQLHGGVMFVDEFPKTPSGKVVKRFISSFVEKNIIRKTIS